MRIRFQEQAFQIAQHLDKVVGYYDGLYADSPYPQDVADTHLKHWGYALENREEAKAEAIADRDVFRYFAYCQFGIVPSNLKGIDKPSIASIHHAITSYERFLNIIHNVNLTNFETLNHRLPGKQYLLLCKKEFRALKYFRFQSSLQGWYDKLPDRIITFEEKHPNWQF